MARSLDPSGPRPEPQVQDLDALGELVRHRRLQLELRIDDAAHAGGVAANVLSRLENGGPVLTDRLLRVLSGLGLTILVVTKEEAAALLPPQHKGRGAGGEMASPSPGEDDEWLK